MSLKVKVHNQIPGIPEKTSKLTIPASWQQKNVSDVVGLFTKAYNTANPEHALVVDDVHLELQNGEKLHSNALVSITMADHEEYFVKRGQHIFVAAAATANDGRLRCRNFGCNQYYTEEENSETSCCHHTAPPIFHDTMKCWSCCRDRKAFDFESFQQIRGCSNGFHSTEVPAIAIAASPNAPVGGPPMPTSNGGAVASQPAQVLKSIDDYNISNPNAASATASAIKTLTTRKSSRQADGVSAKCQRKGCTATFQCADNATNSCRYHKGQAIFHDAAKFWSCCPDRKYYDFDQFMAVPGCTLGCHDDGEVELVEYGPAV